MGKEMNAEEAKKIIAQHEAGECEECFEGECMDEAKGYLEALEGPEVASLIHALEVQLESSGNCTGGCCTGARKALDAFRKAVGK